MMKISRSVYSKTIRSDDETISQNFIIELDIFFLVVREQPRYSKKFSTLNAGDIGRRDGPSPVTSRHTLVIFKTPYGKNGKYRKTASKIVQIPIPHILITFIIGSAYLWCFHLARLIISGIYAPDVHVFLIFW